MAAYARKLSGVTVYITASPYAGIQHATTVQLFCAYRHCSKDSGQAEETSKPSWGLLGRPCRCEDLDQRDSKLAKGLGKSIESARAYKAPD
jgi:hypothetical protein